MDDRYGLVDVKPKSKLNSNDPFVLASQAQQVYYTMYPHNNGRGREDWWAACKVRRKLFIVESFNDEQDALNKMDTHNYYQDDGSFEANNVVVEDEDFFLFDTNSPMEEVDINDIYMPTKVPFTNQYINENDSSENEAFLDEYEESYDEL